MGEFFALAAAFAWAAAVIFFKRSGETIPPFDLNLFRVVVSGVLLVATLQIIGQPLWNQAPLMDYLILILSGIIAIAISDTLFHHSLNIIGAGVSAIVDCLYSPFMVLLGFIILGEQLGPWQFGGMILVMVGILIAAGRVSSSGIKPRRLMKGVLWGVLAMFTLALGIVIAKPVLERTPVLWATTIRQIGCLGVMVPYALFSSRRKKILSVFRPSRAWRVSLPGTVLGSYLALICWVAGMKYTKVGIAAILNQSSTFYVLILAALFLREPFTRQKMIASAVSVTGILMVLLG